MVDPAAAADSQRKNEIGKTIEGRQPSGQPLPPEPLSPGSSASPTGTCRLSFMAGCLRAWAQPSAHARSAGCASQEQN